ncbi:hypothetical protein FACS18949_09650 [Clostridia bacterium]|nr:hypothetical protein FACS18949_09650 [Clostridia bacterium]
MEVKVTLRKPPRAVDDWDEYNGLVFDHEEIWRQLMENEEKRADGTAVYYSLEECLESMDAIIAEAEARNARAI